jgi:hypothetical protein
MLIQDPKVYLCLARDTGVNPACTNRNSGAGDPHEPSPQDSFKLPPCQGPPSCQILCNIFRSPDPSSLLTVLVPEQSCAGLSLLQFKLEEGSLFLNRVRSLLHRHSTRRLGDSSPEEWIWAARSQTLHHIQRLHLVKPPSPRGFRLATLNGTPQSVLSYRPLKQRTERTRFSGSRILLSGN